jgi:hypothetical protein
MPLEPEGGIGNGAGSVDDANRTDGARQAALVPARFRGVWDYTEGSCSEASDLRMEISGSEIMFYESIGIVTAVA